MFIVPARVTGITGAVRGAIRFAGVLPPTGIVPVGITGIKARRSPILRCTGQVERVEGDSRGQEGSVERFNRVTPIIKISDIGGKRS
mgnify:CR=1 FL=1